MRWDIMSWTTYGQCRPCNMRWDIISGTTYGCCSVGPTTYAGTLNLGQLMYAVGPTT